MPMGSIRNRRDCLARIALTALLLGAPSACGKKAPPFLPVPLEAKELHLRNVVVTGGEVHIDFRVPSEIYSIEGEEERWQRAELFRRIEGGAEYEIVAELSVAGGFAFGERGKIVDDSAAAGARYEYRVELRKEESQEWAAAGPVAVTVVQPPALGGDLRVVSREGALALSWDHPPDAPDGTAYLISRRESRGGEWLLLAPRPLAADSYVDTRIDLDQTYCYRVTVIVASGDSIVEGAPSAEVCGAASDTTPPPPPADLLVVSEAKGMMISWIASGAVDVLGYRIYRSVGGGPFSRLNDEPVASARYLDGDVAEGLSYRYRVTAVDSSAGRNESPFSNTAGATYSP